MTSFLEGLGIGFGLSIITGPLVFTLVQTSMERGTRAGFWVAFGIWFSDMAIILFALKSLSLIKEAMQNNTFFTSLGLIGGGILLATGITYLLSKPKDQRDDQTPIRKRNLLGYFVVGILLNAVNPFTIVFWLGLLTTYSIPSESPFSTYYLLLGIMSMIIFGDSMKVLFSKRLSQNVNFDLLSRMRKIAGVILIIFGVLMLVRVHFHV